ncbi:MAG TPA: hypothetical protein VIL46_17225 [Gemmataceae bacterium]
MRTAFTGHIFGLALLAACAAGGAAAEERVEHFDKDPGWDGRNNRATDPPPRVVKQDFGFTRTAHAGGAPGEMGGFITAAAEPAYYAKKIAPKTFDDPLTASGTIACTGRPFHALVGFFNADTLNEWRTPNTIALRISGRGDVFYAWVEYATGRWRAGGDSPRPFPMIRDPKTGRSEPKGFAAKGAVHKWSLRYDPAGNGGAGVVTATIGGETAVCHLDKGHKADGAVFNRFGLLTVMKSADDGGEVWLDDVTVNGEKEDFAADPGWEGFRNRRTYTTTNVRPRFDFGFCPTRHAGGKAAGELGGLVFRGDCRYPGKLACYGDRLAELTLEKPLRASGKVSLRRGVSDSTVLIGFYHSEESMRVNPSQDSGLPENFLGVMVEGPSRDGFFFYPAYRVAGGGSGYGLANRPPPIYPDGASHDWSLEYTPAPDGGGRIRVTLDEKSVSLNLEAAHRKTGARFDRFGIVTTWIDGNGQHIYFDDLRYTARQEEE